MKFNAQAMLGNDVLCLAPLQADDQNGLALAASDPAIWAGHPIKDRYRSDVFAGYFAYLLGTGTTLTVRETTTQRIIGCSRYYVSPDEPCSISIGFTFLTCDHWGGTSNREMKSLMLAHAFETFDAVWFHIDPTNLRSQKATQKLGAKFVRDATLDLSGTPLPWKCYRLSRDDWQ